MTQEPLLGIDCIASCIHKTATRLDKDGSIPPIHTPGVSDLEIYSLPDPHKGGNNALSTIVAAWRKNRLRRDDGLYVISASVSDLHPDVYAERCQEFFGKLHGKFCERPIRITDQVFNRFLREYDLVSIHSNELQEERITIAYGKRHCAPCLECTMRTSDPVERFRTLADALSIFKKK